MCSLRSIAFFLILILVLPIAALAQDGSRSQGQHLTHWLNEAARAYHSQDHEAWVEATTHLHEIRPYNQDFMVHLVKGHALTGNLSAAFDVMLRMQQQGLAVDWDEVEEVESLRPHRLYGHLRDLMNEAGQPFGGTEVWSRLSNDVVMPEAMALDRDSSRVFVGTVRNGQILVSEDDGESWSVFASPDTVAELQGVFDLVVDSDRGFLWVATGRVSHFQGEAREDGVRSSLLRLDLSTGKLDAEFPLSSGGGRNMLGGLVVAEDGTVFASDAMAPLIYRLGSDEEVLQPYFGHQNFTSLRGLALGEDDRLLYIADYELGIFAIDATGSEQAWKLAVPENLNVGGIDGLYYWDGHLVAIQNAISPQRVLRLELGDDGLGVTAVAPIAAARAEFDTPTFGVMDGQVLYFLAGSHWQHVDQHGEPTSSLPEVPILSIDVADARIRVVGQEALEQLQRQRDGQ